MSNGQLYSGCWNQGCLNNGKLVYPNGDVYYGSFRSRLRHGTGKLISYDKHQTLEGEWVDDYLHGHGVSRIYFPVHGTDNGFMTPADYLNIEVDNQIDKSSAAASSIGKYVASTSDDSNWGMYRGNFVLGLRCGFGQMKLPRSCSLYTSITALQALAGATYSGQWDNGEIDGEGKAVYPNGDEYVGSFKKGQRDGKGRMKYANGEEFNGNWIEGETQDRQIEN